MEYKDFKIEVEIEDNKKHTDVAILVDRKDFFEDIVKVRKMLRLSRLLPYGSSLRQNANKHGDTNLKINSEIIAKKYAVPYSEQVVRAAILYGKVADRDYGPLAVPLIISPTRSSDDDDSYQQYTAWIERGVKNLYLIEKWDRPKLGILFSPKATIGDILECVKKSQIDSLKEQHTILEKEIVPSVDTKSEIKEHREWYWENVKGKSYYQIAKGLQEEGDIMDLKLINDRVSKAIQAYKKLLREPLK